MNVKKKNILYVSLPVVRQWHNKYDQIIVITVVNTTPTHNRLQIGEKRRAR
jgi:hypothetical protein